MQTGRFQMLTTESSTIFASSKEGYSSFKILKISEISSSSFQNLSEPSLTLKSKFWNVPDNSISEIF